MTTDAERREATDLWTIQLREQQLNAAERAVREEEDHKGVVYAGARMWKQRAEMAEAERNQLRKANAEQAELLGLAYQVYRDAGGKVGSNSIYSFGEWLQWLPTQTDELLDPQPRV